MFNAGIIASGGQLPAVVKLTSHTMPMNEWNAGSGRYRQVSVQFAQTGELYMTSGNPADEWLLPRGAGAGAAYEIRFTRTNVGANGVQSLDGFDVWHSLGTARAISTIEPVFEVWGTSGTVRVEIRDAATQTIRASANFTFQ